MSVWRPVVVHCSYDRMVWWFDMAHSGCWSGEHAKPPIDKNKTVFFSLCPLIAGTSIPAYHHTTIPYHHTRSRAPRQQKVAHSTTMRSIEDLLVCVRKEHSYSVRRDPQKPTSLLQSSFTESPAQAAETICGVCCRHCARYKCPRCSIDYCCLECYNTHGRDGSSHCKENFYRERSAQHLELQVKERMADTKQLIQRIYEQRTEDASSQAFSQEELINMLKCLEEGDEDKIQKLLESTEVRQALAECLSGGELLDYVLDSWTPWWRPEITDVPDSPSIVDNNLAEAETLDDRLVQVPPLSSLHVDPSRLADLRYNLLDILYAVCWTLRLYHGYSNASESSMYAAGTLMGASLVLSEDARRENLSEVLSSCTALSTQAQKQGLCNASSSCLINDLMLITENQRYVAKALFEAADLLREATTEAKRDEGLESAARFRKGRKKIEFFISWCREASVMEAICGLSSAIQNWRTEWELAGPDSATAERLQRFRLSTPAVPSAFPCTTGQSSTSFLKEVSSRKK